MVLAAESDIDEFLGSHVDWAREGDEITRTYEFADFNQAMGFVTRVALVAEKADHHPDIDIRWSKVTLILSTHSEGGITAKDLSLAGRCDDLA
ncbi:MAG TPA: 4a-hydroxytetrahydrobiopterin dehydratase [Acidimicrobiia bacterium]